MHCIDTGLYTFFVNGLASSDNNPICKQLHNLYPDSISHNESIADYQIDIQKTSLLRTLLRPQVVLQVDGQQPFNPISPTKLIPSIEWCMNWCIAAYDHTHLLIHCSVVEKNGKAILFPARSGSGKSTTSTYLGLNGWHLYYDEMALINLETGKVAPVFRPTSLKNESIEIIRPFVSSDSCEHFLSEVTHNTHKGSIAQVRTMSRKTFDTLQEVDVSAIVYLNYEANANLDIFQVDQAIGFSKLIANAFNYSVIGEPAFHTLTDIVGKAEVFEVSYSQLDALAEFLEELVSV
jgi:HprK-related kinase A